MTVPFPTASLLGLLFSDMFRVVDCHAEDLGSNTCRPKKIPYEISLPPMKVLGQDCY